MKTSERIVSLEECLKQIVPLREKGKTVAFTNGCFDLIHVGHVTYLEQAKSEDRILIVGLNSDASVKKIKKEKLLVNNQQARASVLAALSFVDFVVIFDEETPIRLIEAIKPDVLIKGGDWKESEVVGADLVKENGGRVELLPYLDDYSTTKTIEFIQTHG